MFFNAFSQTRHIFATVTGLVLSSITFADTAGRVNFVAGDVNVNNIDNKSHMLVKGDMVSSGETITTGNKGRIQIRLADGGFLSLRPNSVFQIEKYNFSKDTPTQGSLLFNFIKGGMRTISGAIGKVNRSNYQMNTPFATIGIRGTDYAGDITDDQLLVTVNKGAINVTNDVGNVDIPAGQTFAVKKGHAPEPTNLKVDVDPFETEEELPPCTRGSACTSSTAPITNSAASDDLEERPHLENFASYNEFIHAMSVYQRLEAEKLRVSDAARQLLAAKNGALIDMNLQTLEEGGAALIVNGPEDLNDAIDKAKSFAKLGLADRYSQGRSTFNSFPLKAEDADSLQNASISDTFMVDNDYSIYINNCVTLMHKGIHSCLTNSTGYNDILADLDKYNYSLLPELFMRTEDGLFINIANADGVDFNGLFISTFLNSAFDRINAKVYLGTRSQEQLSQFGVTDSLLSSLDDNKNGLFGGGSIKRGFIHDGDGVGQYKNSGAIEIGDGSAAQAMVILTDDSQPISATLSLINSIDTPADNSRLSINVVTPTIGIKLGGVYVSDSDSAVPGINKYGEPTPGSARIYGTNTDGSTPVQIMGASEIILGAATINAKLVHNPQSDINGNVSPLTILADAFIKDGLVINNLDIRDVAGPFRGGSLGMNSLRISDYSSANLTAKLVVDFERKNEANSIALTLKQLGDIVNGVNITMNRVKVGDAFAKDIGDIEIIGLNLNGLQLVLTSH